MSYDVFISYKKLTGESYATHLKETLEEVGYNCFCADLSIESGEDRKKEIDSAIEECKYFIPVITTYNDFEQMIEIEAYKKAVELNKRIIPCRWSEIEISEEVLQQIEFKNESELANKVICELKRIEKEKIPIEKDAKEFINRGNYLFYYLGWYEEATKEYRKALEIDPNSADAYYNLGIVLLELGRYPEAKKEFKKMIEIDPNNILKHDRLGTLYEQLLYDGDAEEEFRKILKIDPNNSNAHYHLGVVLSSLPYHEEPEKEFRRAIEIDPNNVKAHYYLGELLEHLERYEEAEKEYREVLRINPNDADAHYDLGNVLYHLKRYDEAEKEYREVIRINLNNADTHTNLGALLKHLKRYA